MFVTKRYLIGFLVFVLFESYYSKSIRDDKYFGLFVVNPITGRAPVVLKKVTNAPSYSVPKTTYDWGQWTRTNGPGSGTTYDWGKHTATGTTYDWGQHTATGSTEAPGSRTTYDWGQHTATGTTYDWGQHTATGSTGSRTTYDWGQWTSTAAPGASRTTYDWGQHTGSRTTYDWGQHTSTSSPTDDNSTSTDGGNEYRCPAGKYTCKGTIGLCISLTQICDGKQDCPHRDDENPKVCFPGFGGNQNKKKNLNSFSGTGFMFHIRNVVIKDRSDVRLFDQQSDNRNTRLVKASNQ